MKYDDVKTLYMRNVNIKIFLREAYKLAIEIIESVSNDEIARVMSTYRLSNFIVVEFNLNEINFFDETTDKVITLHGNELLKSKIVKFKNDWKSLNIEVYAVQLNMLEDKTIKFFLSNKLNNNVLKISKKSFGKKNFRYIQWKDSCCIECKFK